MREEKKSRTKTVKEEYSVFIAEDGKVFTSKKECVVYEKIQNGTAKVCPDCHGKKFRYVTTHDFKWVWPYESIEHTEWKKCPTCKGKGYLELKIRKTWE